MLRRIRACLKLFVTWQLTVLPFLHALDLGPRPPRLPACHFADAGGRASLQGPEPLGTLVVHCLPHHKVVDSLRVFVVPWRRLPAVAWKGSLVRGLRSALPIRSFSFLRFFRFWSDSFLTVATGNPHALTLIFPGRVAGVPRTFHIGRPVAYSAEASLAFAV